MQATIETLPRRRGIVMRANGITDSYGQQYIRVNGGLRKVNAPAPKPLVLGGVEI